MLPLLEGGSSQTLNEALSSGLPVVTNDFPNLSDYTNTEAVSTFAPKDYKRMANACINILEDNERFKRLSKKARLHMLEYDYSIIKEKLITIYEDYLDLEISEDR